MPDSSVGKNHEFADHLLLYFFCFVLFYPNATVVLLFADLQIYSITVTAKTSLFQQVKFHCNNM
jgi:hypothetical protein